MADWGTDFQQHFKEILKQFSPVQRPFFVHLTSVIVGPRFSHNVITNGVAGYEIDSCDSGRSRRIHSARSSKTGGPHVTTPVLILYVYVGVRAPFPFLFPYAGSIYHWIIPPTAIPLHTSVSSLPLPLLVYHLLPFVAHCLSFCYSTFFLFSVEPSYTRSEISYDKDFFWARV